jgi:hypothetical protein
MQSCAHAPRRPRAPICRHARPCIAGPSTRTRPSTCRPWARARQAFHRLLAVAYRDALLALARARGAQDIHCSDSGEVLEIEFLLPD